MYIWLIYGSIYGLKKGVQKNILIAKEIHFNETFSIYIIFVLFLSLSVISETSNMVYRSRFFNILNEKKKKKNTTDSSFT